MIRMFGTTVLAGKVVLFIGDIAILALAVIVSVNLRLGPSSAKYLAEQWPSFVFQAAIYICCFYISDLHDLKKDFRRAENILYTLVSCTVAMAISILIFYTQLTYIGRGIFLIYGGLVFSSALMLRLVYAGGRTSRAWKRQLLIVGAGKAGHSLMLAIARHENSGLDVRGFIDDDPAKKGMTVHGAGVLGTSGDLTRLIGELQIDMIVLCITHNQNEELTRILLKCHYNNIIVADMFSVYEGVTGKLPLSQVNSEWLLLSAMNRQRLLFGKIKRMADVVFSLALLLITLPVQAAAALFVWLESGKPVLYSQERLGRDYHKFNIYKFRTMVQDAEKDCGAVWSVACDTRVTRVGKVLRRLRIDELPQLYNVLRGDMSFVGPRPEREVFVKELEKELPSYGHRLVVKPGLTGWAQVMQGYAASVDESREKLRYDLYYVKNMSLMLDLLIILRTIKVVLLFKGH